jgi:hypothetical protein
MSINDKTFKYAILGILLLSSLYLTFVAARELKEGETYVRQRHYQMSFDSSKEGNKNFEQFVYLKFGIGAIMIVSGVYVWVKWKV